VNGVGLVLERAQPARADRFGLEHAVALARSGHSLLMRRRQLRLARDTGRAAGEIRLLDAKHLAPYRHCTRPRF